MTKPNNFPREKDRALPWSKGLPIFNTATGRYELSARPKSRSEKSAVVVRGVGLGPRPVSSTRPGDKKRKLGGGVSFAPPKKRRFVRQKNGGLPDDFPTVLFPGEPMAMAVKKTEELKEEFPGIPLPAALEKKKAAEGAKTKKTKKEEGGRAAQVPRRTRVPAGEEKGRKRKAGEEGGEKERETRPKRHGDDDAEDNDNAAELEKAVINTSILKVKQDPPPPPPDDHCDPENFPVHARQEGYGGVLGKEGEVNGGNQRGVQSLA